MGAMVASNQALQYINYPTQVRLLFTDSMQLQPPLKFILLAGFRKVLQTYTGYDTWCAVGKKEIPDC